MVLVMHREDGPAAIWKSGCEEYYFKGKRHRVDGPAVINPDGKKRYFLEGIEYVESDSLGSNGVIIGSGYFVPKKV
jgi:hypothetical protein